ncbi:FkbM family methyltransferase [Oscillibacter sp.]|uniref:FkbM family methyltransferase n=1 Tax=Oscillibacter sp. TaxID=1945593 RepID=UPI0028A0E261|nr:FkbM family methyltransferase [Oscillibacter sp.]
MIIQHYQDENDIFLRENTSDFDIYQQLLLKNEYGYFDVEGSVNTIVDLGANIGLASIYFAKKFPKAHIIAVEPDEENYKTLLMNIAPYPQITPFYGAIFEKDQKVSIVDVGIGTLGYQVQESLSTNAGIVGMTMNTFFRTFQLEKIDILKMDIEGSERDLFKKDYGWLSHVDFLIIELHERIKAHCNQVVFDAIGSGFPYQWIGEENFYFAKSHKYKPYIPDLYKGELPQKLPAEIIWEKQAAIDMQERRQADTINRLEQKVDTLEHLYKRIDALESLHTRADGLEQKVNNLEHLYERMDALESLHIRADGLEQKVNGLEHLYERMDALESLYIRADGLEQKVDDLEHLYERIDRLETVLYETK